MIFMISLNIFLEQCWENQIGAQMYNLIWIDLFVVVAVTICAETLRK